MIRIIDVLEQLFPNVVRTRSEGRRLIQQRAVKVDHLVVEDPRALIVGVKVKHTDYWLIAVVEGRYVDSLQSGENITLEIDQQIDQSVDTVVVEVGKKHKGLVVLKVP